MEFFYRKFVFFYQSNDTPDQIFRQQLFLSGPFSLKSQRLHLTEYIGIRVVMVKSHLFNNTTLT